MEGFFIQSCSIDKITEIEELLLRRYTNFDYILKLNYREGIEFILKAYEKELEEKLWQQWLVDYRWMNKDNFISFEEYKNKKEKGNSTDEKLTTKEIENKVKEIINLTL